VTVRAVAPDRPRAPAVKPSRLPRPSLPWLVAALAAAVAIVFASLWWAERAKDARRAEVEETARAFLVALTNFEAGTIDQDVAEIRSYAVGGFAREVDETFSAERVEAIQTNEATSQGRVRTLVVHRLGEDTASAFGVVDETVTNSASPEPRADVLRVELGLIETSEAWKVDRVEILQAPSTAPTG
jgi:Mce-associated membrane protein